MSDFPQKLLIGDRAPPFLGFTQKGSLYTSEDQTGRAVVLIMAKSLAAPELPSLLETFSEQSDAFIAAGMDIAALIGAKVEDVFEFSVVHSSRIALVGSLNHFNFPVHIAFDDNAPYVIVLDRNMRVAARMDNIEDPRKAVAHALIVAQSLPNEPVRDVILPAPVLILPNVFDRSFCDELIELHKAGPTFESSSVVLGGDGKTRIKVKPETKVRRDYLIKREHPMFTRVFDSMKRRIFPEIKRCFQFDITHTDIFLIACYPGGGGHFTRHRDDRPKAVSFRRFALSINLTPPNKDFEGGSIHLPEFSPHNYRTPSGGAIIFSVALMHQITPVISGDRYVLVTHLFDEQGELERRAIEGEDGKGDCVC